MSPGIGGENALVKNLGNYLRQSMNKIIEDNYQFFKNKINE